MKKDYQTNLEALAAFSESGLKYYRELLKTKSDKDRTNDK